MKFKRLYTTVPQVSPSNWKQLVADTLVSNFPLVIWSVYYICSFVEMCKVYKFSFQLCLKNEFLYKTSNLQNLQCLCSSIHLWLYYWYSEKWIL